MPLTGASGDGSVSRVGDVILGDFQTLLDWKTGIRLPDGRILGVPRKGRFIVEQQDRRIALLAERFQTADKSILEFGCLEGTHTVQLAQVCREVTAVDVRPKNIV